MPLKWFISIVLFIFHSTFMGWQSTHKNHSSYPLDRCQQMWVLGRASLNCRLEFPLLFDSFSHRSENHHQFYENCHINTIVVWAHGATFGTKCSPKRYFRIACSVECCRKVKIHLFHYRFVNGQNSLKLERPDVHAP